MLLKRDLYILAFIFLFFSFAWSKVFFWVLSQTSYATQLCSAAACIDLPRNWLVYTKREDNAKRLYGIPNTGLYPSTLVGGQREEAILFNPESKLSLSVILIPYDSSGLFQKVIKTDNAGKSCQLNRVDSSEYSEYGGMFIMGIKEDKGVLVSIYSPAKEEKTQLSDTLLSKICSLYYD